MINFYFTRALAPGPLAAPRIRGTLAINGNMVEVLERYAPELVNGFRTLASPEQKVDEYIRIARGLKDVTWQMLSRATVMFSVTIAVERDTVFINTPSFEHINENALLIELDDSWKSKISPRGPGAFVPYSSSTFECLVLDSLSDSDPDLYTQLQLAAVYQEPVAIQHIKNPAAHPLFGLMIENDGMVFTGHNISTNCCFI